MIDFISKCLFGYVFTFIAVSFIFFILALIGLL